MSSPTELAGQKPTTARARSDRSRDDPVEQSAAVVVQRPCRLADAGGRRGSPGTCPSAPRPRRRATSRSARPARPEGSRRTPERRGSSAGAPAARSRRGSGSPGPSRSRPSGHALAPPGPLDAGPLLVGAHAGRVGRGAVAEQLRDDAHRPRRVGHVDHRRAEYRGAILTAVWARDVVAPPISSGTREPLALHLAGDVGHLLERGRDQAGQADHVDALSAGPSPGSAPPGP